MLLYHECSAKVEHNYTLCYDDTYYTFMTSTMMEQTSELGTPMPELGLSWIENNLSHVKTISIVLAKR